MDLKFKIDSSVQTFLKEYAHHDSVASVSIRTEDGDRFGYISPETLRELERVQNLFEGRKYAEKRFIEAASRVERAVQDILSQLGKSSTDANFKNAANKVKISTKHRHDDRYVGSNNSSISVQISGIGAADHLIDDSDIEHDSLYYRGGDGGEVISDAAQSFDWAAWLGDERSPYFSSDFLEGYLFDQASIALELFSQTIDETDFNDVVNSDLSRRIIKLAKEMSAIF